MTPGPYDDGYCCCPCFWGSEPGSLVKLVPTHVPLDGARVLDAGCGEGKNAVFLASMGAQVDALDASAAALANARAQWGHVAGVRFLEADIRVHPVAASAYRVIVAYGVLHCLESPAEIYAAVERWKAGLEPGGLLVLCAFNDRHHDLEHAHPNMTPTLISHRQYLSWVANLQILATSDTDLVETHPHNGIEHRHSMTRILAKKATHARP